MPQLNACPPRVEFFAGLKRLAATPHIRKLLVLVTCLIAAYGLPGATRHVFASTFTVTNTNDSGAGSLRQAIADANANPGLDTINFALPGGGIPSIQPLSQLPSFISPVLLLATNADGSNCNTWPPTIGVELNGISAGIGVDGLRFAAGSSGSQVSGLAINRFSQDGIDITTSNIVVACNYLGLDKTGSTAAGNAENGVLLWAGVNNTMIGRYNAWVGNVIAGNTNGIFIFQDGAANNTVRGNFIGTDKTGNLDLGNTRSGVFIGYGAGKTIVGGSTASDRNLISGNNAFGIEIYGGDTHRGENQIAGNFIGSNASGVGALPNGGTGIDISFSPSNTIGGPSAGSANLIAFNQGNGILLNGFDKGNRIQGNSIVSNSLLGIELFEDGPPSGSVTPNDVGDGDNGPNGLQNFPVLSEAHRVLPGATVVQGTLNSAANTTYQLEFFSTSTCDASGYGEGERFLGRVNVTTDPSGVISFTEGLAQLAPSGSRLVATATDPGGNTSEFSACVAVAEASPETSEVVIARGDSTTTAEDTPITLDVLANDLNLGNGSLVLSNVGATPDGTTAIIANRVVFTPAANFNGSTVFFYGVHNGLITKTVQASVRVLVTAVNDSPTDILLDSSSIAENQPAGTRISFLSALDPDGDTDFVYSLVVARNTDNAFFSIGRNVLYARDSFDFETRSSYTVRLRVTDRNGASFDKSFVINVLNTNDAPTAIRLRGNRVAENQLAGASVGGLSSVDPDVGDTFTYELVPGAGSNHNANFRIEGAALKTNTALDYEAQMIHSIRVRSTDQRGASFEQTLLVYVDDVPSPPDAPVNTLSKCNGNTITLIDANPNDANRRVLVKIENIVVTNKTATSCAVSGKLSLTTNGSTQANIIFTGAVNDKDQFASGTLSDFTLNVVGLTLQAKEVSIEYYLNRPGLRIAKPALQMPSEWGGLSTSLPLPSLIDTNGLKLGTGKISLPTIKTKSGFALDLSGSLVAIPGGYQIVADGELSIPNIGKSKKTGNPGQSCTIAAGVTIYVGALGQTVMRIETADTYEAGRLSPAAFDVLRLQQIRASFSCEEGIAIGSTGMFLTSLSGEITLTPNNETVNVAVKIVGGKKLPALGTVLGLDGTMNLKINPTFQLDLGVAINLLSFKIATAQAKITKTSFSSTLHIVGIFLDATASINAWSSDNKFHFTGSGRLALQINKGAISSSCADIPCGVKICKKWGIPYPCGVNYCSVCINIPPFNTGKLAEVGVDVGEFTNGRYGFKGFISIVGKTVGFYVDERGTLSFGNVQQYQLITGPSVAAAHAAWLQSLKSGMSLRPDVLGPYTFSGDENSATPSVIINTPLNKGAATDLENMRQPFGAHSASGVTDVISKVNLIQEADVGFGLKARGLLTFTLLTPQGGEITPNNLPSNVVFTSSASYERESGEPLDATQARLRYTPLSTDPEVNGVDMRVDGITVYVNTSYNSPEALEYIALTPGDHVVELVKTGSNQVVLSETIDLVENDDYSLMTVRKPIAALALRALEGSSEFSLKHDDNSPPADSAQGQAHVMMFNGFSSNLSLYVDGILAVNNLPPKVASNYDTLAAGQHTLELHYAASGVAASSPTQINVIEGGVYSFFASEDPMGLNAAALLQRADEAFVRSYTSEYSVDQANLGEWKVKLTGDTDHTTYLISVAGPASPPVLSALTVNASNPAAIQVSWRLVSDYSPTTIQLYINPGPITQSITLTDIHGLLNTQDVPAYEGYGVAEFVMTGTAQLNGQVMNRVIDLSKLTSGTYHLWMRAQDGVSPPVNGYLGAASVFARLQPFDAYGTNAVRVAKNGYSALAQLADAAPIVINHANDFPTTWAATIATTLTTTNDVGSLYVQWNAPPHPDVDNYRLLFSTNTLTATQVLTAGGAVTEFDENGNASGSAYGFTTLNNIEPGVTYSLSIEAIDTELNRSVRSQSVAFSASPGSYALAVPQASYAITRNAQLTVPVSLMELQPLFFKQVALSTDLGQVPLGINAGFVDDVDGATTLSPSQPTAQLNISVDGAVPDGRYRLRVLGYNGNQKQGVVITIVVGNPKAYIYLPMVRR